LKHLQDFLEGDLQVEYFLFQQYYISHRHHLRLHQSHQVDLLEK
jgi:hypothetical protein